MVNAKVAQINHTASVKPGTQCNQHSMIVHDTDNWEAANCLIMLVQWFVDT
jgi:hypothetical protein